MHHRKKKPSEQLWKEAKRKCRLNNDDIQIAKRLGIHPRSLIKNIPNKNEKWKLPVKDWLHEIEAKNKAKTKSPDFSEHKRI